MQLNIYYLANKTGEPCIGKVTRLKNLQEWQGWLDDSIL